MFLMVNRISGILQLFNTGAQFDFGLRIHLPFLPSKLIKLIQQRVGLSTGAGH